MEAMTVRQEVAQVLAVVERASSVFPSGSERAAQVEAAVGRIRAIAREATTSTLAPADERVMLHVLRSEVHRVRALVADAGRGRA